MKCIQCNEDVSCTHPDGICVTCKKVFVGTLQQCHDKAGGFPILVNSTKWIDNGSDAILVDKIHILQDLGFSTDMEGGLVATLKPMTWILLDWFEGSEAVSAKGECICSFVGLGHDASCAWLASKKEA